MEWKAGVPSPLTPVSGQKALLSPQFPAGFAMSPACGLLDRLCPQHAHAAELPYGGGATCVFCLCTDSQSCGLPLSLCLLTSSSPVRGQSVGTWGRVHVTGRPWCVFLCRSTGFQRGVTGLSLWPSCLALPERPWPFPGVA